MVTVGIWAFMKTFSCRSYDHTYLKTIFGNWWKYFAMMTPIWNNIWADLSLDRDASGKSKYSICRIVFVAAFCIIFLYLAFVVVFVAVLRIIFLALFLFCMYLYLTFVVRIWINIWASPDDKDAPSKRQSGNSGNKLTKYKTNWNFVNVYDTARLL